MKNLIKDINEVLVAMPIIWSAAPRFKHVLTAVFIALAAIPVVPSALVTPIGIGLIATVMVLAVDAILEVFKK